MGTLVLYLSVDILAVLLLYIADKRKVKPEKKGVIYKYKFFYVLSLLALLVIVGFRNITVGVDTTNYVNAFYRVVEGISTPADMNWLSIGYMLTLKLIGVFSSNYVILNCVIGLISLTFLYKSIWNNSEKPTLSLFLFICMNLYYQMFNQSRQLLAVCIVLYSFKYIKERNFKMYLIYTLLATSMHESAIIMLPFYFITDYKINKKNVLFYFIAIFIAYFGFGYLEKLILLTEYGKTYYGTDYFVSSKTSVINLVFRFCLMIFILIYSKKSIENDKNNKYLINFSIFCTLLQVLTLRLYILGRLTTYFYAFYILSIPNTIASMERNKINTLIKYGVIIIFILYHFVYFKFNSTIAGYDIYSFCFNKYIS